MKKYVWRKSKEYQKQEPEEMKEGRRKYAKEGRRIEITVIIKVRLHMVCLPCNYKSTQEDGKQCRLSSSWSVCV